MQDWLSARAAATPDQLAIAGFFEKSDTFAQLRDGVDAYREWLSAAGVQAGSKVAVLMPNRQDYPVIVHTLAAIGAVLVPLNTRLTVDEVKWQVAFTGCTLLICSQETEEFAIQLLDVLLVWSIDDTGSGICLWHDQQYDYVGLKLSQYQPIDLNATQAIVFTSGTSGKPKGVEITFGNHFYSAMASAYRLGLHPNDRWLSVLPLYHMGGLAVIFRSTLYGITTVLHGRFDIERIQHSFDHHGITMISLVPTMLYRMIEAGVRFPDSLRLILLGGAAASPELLERAFDMGLPVAPTYGLTEAASQVATLRPEDARKKPGSVGKPLLFTSVRIADENGASLPAEEYGEIVVSGPTVMKSYYKNDEANAKTLRNGELHTGDIGYLDEDGDLWLVQRRSDLIVSGGENVYPAEVESVLRGHPAVQDVCVVGVDHLEWGQQVAAAVVLREGGALTVDELIAYSRKHLAAYKQPRRVIFVDVLPQTSSGKIKRDGVRALF